MSEQWRDEGGQALVMALLALALAVLLVSGFLFYASTSQRATRAARERTLDHYSTDAGAEHALWRLQSEPGFRQLVDEQAESGSPYTYTIVINGRRVAITVTRVLTP